MKLKNKLIIGSVILIMLSGCSEVNELDSKFLNKESSTENDSSLKNIEIKQTFDVNKKTKDEASEEDSQKTVLNEKNDAISNVNQLGKNQFEGYTLIEVDGGDRNGNRKANVVVDIGFGDREYWAFTNAYGQLIRVIADRITLQDPSTEAVNSNGRYYDDEAYVPGVEAADLDQGHVIADSLGGVANAYNITPQNSTLNRHGDQAYMEKVMRQAGGSTNFEAIITYPNTTTQIPSNYKYTYYINGDKVELSFDNKNPEESKTSKPTTASSTNTVQQSQSSEADLVRKIDTNNNGQISIKEAKAAGYKMPIYSNHWLYKYMTDGDGDGMVGE